MAGLTETVRVTPRKARRSLTAVESPWVERAACRGMDSAVFFPVSEEGISITPALKVCARCPVRPVCAAHAVLVGESYGVWGGLSVQDRRAIRSLMFGDRDQWISSATRARAESAVLGVFGDVGLLMIKAPEHQVRTHILELMYMIGMSTSAPPWTSR